MAATPLSEILTRVRRQLTEKVPHFWSDDELTAIFVDGVTDLWGAILDLHQDHYFVVSEDGSVKQRASQSVISGVPDDCFRVKLIEPITSSDSASFTNYLPKSYSSNEFTSARRRTATDPATAPTTVYYDVTGPGAPVAAPIIRVAPVLSSDLALRLAYFPMLAVNDVNPVPGGSDNALKAWVLAYAMAKEGPQGQRIPDLGWLNVYATEKQSVLTRLTPRQEQEPDVVEDLFQGFGHF